MTRDRFAPADEGKAVCSTDGVTLGWVMTVERGTALVCPKEGLVDRYGSLLAPCWRRGRHYRLDSERIHSISAREVTVDVNVSDLRPSASPTA